MFKIKSKGYMALVSHWSKTSRVQGRDFLQKIDKNVSISNILRADFYQMNVSYAGLSQSFEIGRFIVVQGR